MPTTKSKTIKVTKPKKTVPVAPKVQDVSTVLEAGKKAPNFTLPSDHHGEVSLSDYRGKKKVVLYFYPKDNTPGCTKQACAFQAASKKISKADAVVIGVSPDTVVSHAKFRAKFGLEFILVSDVDHKLAEEYGVWTLKKNYGKTYMGIQRATFLIGKDGVIEKVWPKVSVEGHDEEVLEALVL